MGVGYLPIFQAIEYFIGGYSLALPHTKTALNTQYINILNLQRFNRLIEIVRNWFH